MLSKPVKTLGVLGGMGPAACAEFLRILAKDSPAKNDSQHPKIIMLSDPETPDRSDGLMGLGPDPEPVIRKNLFKLAEWGADLLAVPCNTAHYFIDRFRKDLPVPLIHIVESTVEAARELSQGNCSWLLATDGTIKSLIYQTCAEKLNYHFLRPSREQQNNIQSCIRLVKAGDLHTAGELLRDTVNQLWRERNVPVTMGCTEIPLAYAVSGLPDDKQVSSLQSLSNACIRVLYEL
ncbi:MAG: amino acid racemase [Synergistaceae bacterium]|nr:amino acid racemase [Synergistaceae bacterium]